MIIPLSQIMLKASANKLKYPISKLKIHLNVPMIIKA